MTPEERAYHAEAQCDAIYPPCTDCVAAAIRAAVEEERAACAGVARAHALGEWAAAPGVFGPAGLHIEAAIRARAHATSSAVGHDAAYPTSARPPQGDSGPTLPESPPPATG